MSFTEIMNPYDQLIHPSIQQEILRCEVGSSAHGVNLPGTDDFDMIGVAIEQPGYSIGLDEFKMVGYRTAEIRDGKKNTRSQAGDIDLSVHSLRTFARLAAKGNPSILLVLYAPVIFSNSLGRTLRDNRQLFVSKEAGKRFLGYLTAQKERLTGERGQKNVNRPELVDKYGYDTKYAMHAIRLGYQGLRLMETGEMPVPLEPEMQEYLLGLRQGQVGFKAALGVIEWFEEDLKRAIVDSKVPDQANTEKINELLIQIYSKAWRLCD